MLEATRDTLPVQTRSAEPELALKSLESLADTSFVRLADYTADFEYDLRYATTDNFLKAKVYPCAECYTRVKTARALIAANSDLKKQGYRIKFYDCYRPNSVQYKMWEIVPNPQYVANPVKGSIHNKGGAVDITLVTLPMIRWIWERILITLGSGHTMIIRICPGRFLKTANY